MTYEVYGSQTSPFVRRIRMLLHGQTCEFRELNIFETQDALALNKINPLNQVPVLKHGNKKIWDSRQIFQYLNKIHNFEEVDWEGENLLTAIQGAMDSGIALLLMKRSGMNIDENFMYINRQKDRIESVLDYLSPYLKEKALTEWNFATMTMYAFLDWALFRNIINIENRPEVRKFLDTHSQRPAVIASAIPKV
ncbi:MAG: glutathione S-transferase family protein [Bdellovibrionota bacterium]